VYLRKLVRIHPLVVVLARRVQSRGVHEHV